MKFKKFRFKKVKSTNNTAIRIIKNSNLKYGMVLSDAQTMGRGQYGKKWISYRGNLFVSFFYELENINLTIPRLTKINCLLIKKLLKNYYKKDITFKKPNDLLVQKKKICGILQETISILDKKFLIIGIGINIKKSPKIKNYPTISLYELINKTINKTEIENKLKLIFETNLLKMYKVNR
ncbi:biotin--[acetyl-CoA-carboxylase] ligase [Candidatus Pelagibacter bacterium nBUS_33]|jgi:BirA family transcriptional regulator, biotin operon repressor / biotin---[acetyl-CoA-carboxylase] ligase|uniref:biotin--[acetyl-CoA-carboxylase] ligase n=1 Tax=Candidatus Pelagibacter bacterium nBUS_33 TaxID=3374193 RepID=UPI003EBD3CDB